MRHGRYITAIRRLALAAGAGAALAGALPAVANADCPGGPVTHPFEAFGDNADYVAVPGGGFESGAAGWSLTGAQVVEGNEPFLASGTHSLEIEAGGEAVSPPVCVGGEYPTFRFFARRLTGTSRAGLSASLRWVDLLGIAAESPAGTVPASGDWAPSPAMRLGDTLPVWLGDSTLEVELVFRSSGESSWAIDDAYIDPYSR